jgi:CDP-diacylglycerol--glycerol-3-phosphate 3-phosphatidyltransferase
MTISTPTPESGPRPDQRLAKLAMGLTIARFVAAPLAAGLILWGHHVAFTKGAAAMGTLYAAALAVFVLAALSDWADGALARRAGATSPLGAALDHAADKVLTSLVLIALAYAVLPLPLVVAALILIGRDFLIAGLREGLSGAGPAVAVAGKAKAAAAMIGILAVLAEAVAGAFGWRAEALRVLGLISHAGLWTAAALAIMSAVFYIKEAASPKASPGP